MGTVLFHVVLLSDQVTLLVGLLRKGSELARNDYFPCGIVIRSSDSVGLLRKGSELARNDYFPCGIVGQIK